MKKASHLLCLRMKTMIVVATMFLLIGTIAQSITAQDLPTLFIVGDSTVKNGTRGQRGWGEEIGDRFNHDKIRIENHAIGGRSSRTFQTEGRWDRVLKAAKAGDYVLIQLGHNDSGAIDDEKRARASLPGIGDESREIDNPITKKKEVVHTYGWYLRKYIADARAKSLIPILVSPVPRVPKEKLKAAEREKSRHVQWCADVAEAENVLFIDLNLLVMEKYLGLEPTEIKEKYFSESDNTHTSSEGAKLNAHCVADGIRKLERCDLGKYLKP